ncbi:hypothetical protein NLX83_01750 [Allokutzneria sp. A3M-2-11 16]|uniref:hypothetical protein n=1 Tax=Allokutzneria sp. A3M-2-11 16 TaxID=2962043 RepID=UPI0020B74A52|nr:hypothetical protein [Allokutzneria sp. A3M-2-11 16]MCP3797973.1 hypothetical protein [Allokutzneria sp. A3M-2-11 16]
METLEPNEPSKEQIHNETFHYQKIGRIEAHFDEGLPSLTVSGETSDGVSVDFTFSPSEILELAALVARNQEIIARGVGIEEELLKLDPAVAKIRTGELNPIPTNQSIYRSAS